MKEKDLIASLFSFSPLPKHLLFLLRSRETELLSSSTAFAESLRLHRDLFVHANQSKGLVLRDHHQQEVQVDEEAAAHAE